MAHKASHMLLVAALVCTVLFHSEATTSDQGIFIELVKELHHHITNQTRQYGILYVTTSENEQTPNLVSDEKWIEKIKEQNRNKDVEIYPVEQSSPKTSEVHSNFVITTPLHKYKLDHTEHILLNTVYDNMMKWFKQRRLNKAHKTVYLFTKHFPCQKCTKTIEHFVNESAKKRRKLILGYGSQSWNRRKENLSIIKNTTNRLSMLDSQSFRYMKVDGLPHDNTINLQPTSHDEF